MSSDSAPAAVSDPVPTTDAVKVVEEITSGINNVKDVINANKDIMVTIRIGARVVETSSRIPKSILSDSFLVSKPFGVAV